MSMDLKVAKGHVVEIVVKELYERLSKFSSYTLLWRGVYNDWV